MSSALRFGFDAPVPAVFDVGRGAILLVRGWIAPPRGITLHRYVAELDGEPQCFDAHGQIRFDLPPLRDQPPLGIFVPIAVDGRRAGARAHLRLRVEHSGGATQLVDQPIDFTPATRATISLDTTIMICLGTYNPDEELLVKQLDSLREQTRRDWLCLVYDDGSTAERFAMIQRCVAVDSRFRLLRSERNRGFYRNFEAALALVPSSTPYVALCDQDDRWEPDKLAVTIAALDADPSAQLAYCDMRIVDRDGRVRSPTYWQTRRNNYTQLDTLFYANTVTGAASLFRGVLLDSVLPFPPEQGPTFHDHWLACAAFVAGGLAYVDRPLYDYTQHGANVIGHSNFSVLTIGSALQRHAFNLVEMIVKPQQAWKNLWTVLAFYHFGYRRLYLIAETLRLRFPAMKEEVRDVLALFDDHPERGLELMTRRHADVLGRGDTTDMAEFKMGMGLLLHYQLSSLLPPLVGWKDRLLGRRR